MAVALCYKLCYDSNKKPKTLWKDHMQFRVGNKPYKNSGPCYFTEFSRVKWSGIY
jgi:hypothetical protein